MVWFPSCFYFDISTSINQTWYSLVSLLLEKRNFQFAFIKNVSLLSTRWLTAFFWFSLLKPEGCVCPLLTVYEVKPRHWPPAPPPPTAMCHCLQCPVPWCCSLFGSLFLLYQILSGGKKSCCIILIVFRKPFTKNTGVRVGGDTAEVICPGFHSCFCPEIQSNREEKKAQIK